MLLCDVVLAWPRHDVACEASQDISPCIRCSCLVSAHLTFGGLMWRHALYLANAELQEE